MGNADQAPGCKRSQGSQRVRPPRLNMLRRLSAHLRTSSRAARISGQVSASAAWMNSAPPSTGWSQKSRTV